MAIVKKAAPVATTAPAPAPVKKKVVPPSVPTTAMKTAAPAKKTLEPTAEQIAAHAAKKAASVAAATGKPVPGTKTSPAASAGRPSEVVAARDGKHIGKSSGLRVMDYQDYTMTLQESRQLTDEELGADWSNEFPNTRCVFKDRMDIVRIVRRLFNEGKHGKQTRFPGENAVPRYELQNGKRVAVADENGGRGRKANGAAEATA